MARMIPTHLAPGSLSRRRVTVTSELLNAKASEVFPTVDAPGLPRDQLPEVPGALLATADDHRPADAGAGQEEPDPEQEHGPGDELEPAQADAQEVERREDGGDDVEHDGDHAGPVPALRPFNPTQLKEGLARWCDGLTSFDDQAVGLSQVELAAGALAEARGELVEKLVEGFPRNERTGKRVTWTETPAGALKRDRSGGSSNWDAELIWPDLLAEARRRCAHPETGELTPEAEAGAQAMLTVLKEVISSPSFRVRALEKLGIDPDEVRATTPSRIIVRFA